MNDKEIMIMFIYKVLRSIKSLNFLEFYFNSYFRNVDIKMIIKDCCPFLYNNYKNINISCLDKISIYFMINIYIVDILYGLFDDFVDIYKSEELNIDNENKYKFLLKLNKSIQIMPEDIIVIKNRDLLNMLKKQGKYPLKENYFLFDNIFILNLIDDIIYICCNKENK